MFSDNGQISVRQLFRLMTYDLIGISTLLLPGLLASGSGCDGIFCIVVGTAAAYGYTYALRFAKRAASGKRYPVLILLFVLIQSILVSGYTGFVFADLVKKSLLSDESFWVILVLIFLLGIYGMWDGLEGRARVYEVLFWFILIPLFLMLAGASAGVDTDYWTPVFFSDFKSFLRGSYLVFLFFSSVVLVMFLPGYEKERQNRKAFRAVGKAVLFAGGLLAVVYLILLGNFGSDTLADMEYPAVTVMSTVRVFGGFMKRVDALMLGIWFFTLYALLNSSMYYAGVSVQKFAKTKNRWIFVIVATASFFLSACFYRSQAFQKGFLRYFCRIGVPILLVLPFLSFIYKNRKRTVAACLSLLLFLPVLWLSGCSSIELEDRCFPLMMVLDRDSEKDQVAVTCLYQETDGASEDTFVVLNGGFGDSLLAYQENMNKSVDFHHLKVLLVSDDFMEDGRCREDLLAVFDMDKSFPRNTYVCVSSRPGEILGVRKELSCDPGTYLEELLENQKPVSANGLPDLQALYNERKNQMETLFFPHICVKNGVPVLDSYFCMRRGEALETVPALAANLAFLENNSLRKWDIAMDDGRILCLEAFRTNYDFSLFGRVTVHVHCEGRMKAGKPYTSEEASGFVSRYFTELAQTEKKAKSIDVSNSYKKLAGHNRSWYESWIEQKISHTVNAPMDFEENTDILYEVSVHMTGLAD